MGITIIKLFVNFLISEMTIGTLNCTCKDVKLLCQSKVCTLIISGCNMHYSLHLACFFLNTNVVSCFWLCWLLPSTCFSVNKLLFF